MKTATLKLCVPVMAMTAQQSAVMLVIPPFLDHLKYPLSAIGSLISLAPVFAFASRLPSGMAYRGHRMRGLMSAALLALILLNLLYIFAVTPFYFGLVHSLSGFFYGAAGTIYLAFFVDALPPEEDRRHAMGYYAGSLAVGYSTGGFVAGYAADRFGYPAGFELAALLGLLCLALILFLRQPETLEAGKASRQAEGGANFFRSLKGLFEPGMASVVVVAVFLNLLHQMGSAFLPLYGLAVGLTLTQVGVIKGLYALCNAITRPISGMVIKRFRPQVLSTVGFSLQSAFLMLVPFFHGFGTLVIVFVLAGFMRAVLIVANTISLVENADRSRVGRGMASGIFNAAGDVGNILGPSAGGAVASFTGVTDLFFVGPVTAVALFFTSLWACRFLKRRPVQGVEWP